MFSLVLVVLYGANISTEMVEDKNWVALEQCEAAGEVWKARLRKQAIDDGVGIGNIHGLYSCVPHKPLKAD